MTAHSNTDKYFYVGLPVCLLFSVLLSSLLSYFHRKQLLDEFVGLEFATESNTDFDATLYYTYTDTFNTSGQLQNIWTQKDIARFIFPKKNAVVKKFRLDFGSNPALQTVKIKELMVLFKDKKIRLTEKQVFDAFFVHSASITLDRNQRTLTLSNIGQPFDPYIVFSPLSEVTKSSTLSLLALLLPFLALIVLWVIKFGKPFKKINAVDILVGLFIISIPLKIAWTTFSVLLLCGYGTYHALRNRMWARLNPTFYLFLVFFGIMVVMGRPASMKVIDDLWALPLMALVSLTLLIPKAKTYRFFVLVMLVFNAIVVASGINFLLWFREFYGLGFVDYFREIKIYSGNVRDWLYYDHAVFLSFFGLVGLLFVHSLLDRQKLHKRVVFLYHVFLLAFIVIVGARICIPIYLLFLLNLGVNWSIKKRVVVNSILFLGLAVTLVLAIKEIDLYRYQLWKVSWEAIKEKPWFGYGLNSSNEVLHNPIFIELAGFKESLEMNHSHNQFLTFMLEIGILGLVGILAALLYFLYRTKYYLNVPLILFLLGFGLICLTESILQTSKPLYVISFLFLLLTMDLYTKTTDNALK